MIQSDPSGRFVLAADLGLDRILVWKFDARAGGSSLMILLLSRCPGRRSAALRVSSERPLFYSLQEEGSTLVRSIIDGACRASDGQTDHLFAANRALPGPATLPRSPSLPMRVSSMPPTGCTTPLPGFQSPPTGHCDSLARSPHGATIHALSPLILPGVSCTGVINARMPSCHSA